jgi:hypothetical protein
LIAPFVALAAVVVFFWLAVSTVRRLRHRPRDEAIHDE